MSKSRLKKAPIPFLWKLCHYMCFTGKWKCKKVHNVTFKSFVLCDWIKLLYMRQCFGKKFQDKADFKDFFSENIYYAWISKIWTHRGILSSQNLIVLKIKNIVFNAYHFSKKRCTICFNHNKSTYFGLSLALKPGIMHLFQGMAGEGLCVLTFSK